MNNIYSLFLNSVVEGYVLNKDYIKDLEIAVSYDSLKSFNSNFRTYSMDLGRRLGATTAIKQYIDNHPELTFVYVSSMIMWDHVFGAEKLKNVSFCSSIDSLQGKFSNTDIFLFDNYTLLTKNKIFKDLDDMILDNMNTHCLNQIYVRFQ